MEFHKNMNHVKILNLLKKITIFSLVLWTIQCPIAKKIYILDSGDTDVIERKDAQAMVNNALWIYISKCRDEKLQAGIINYWDPILKAKPCGGGNLSLKNSALVYCYEKLFLDKSNIDSCSLLLIAGSCSGSNWQKEMAVSHTFCKSSLVLENYTNLIKFF
jgi:hypothetical protein